MTSKQAPARHTGEAAGTASGCPPASRDARRDASRGWVLFLFAVPTYLVILMAQSHPEVPFMFKGVIAQFQVMICILLTLRRGRIGYGVSVVLCLLTLGGTLAGMVVRQDPSYLSGIAVPAGTLVVLTILTTFSERLKERLSEEHRQRCALSAANEALAAREQQVSEQNLQLLQYSRELEDKEETLTWLASFDTLTGLPNRKAVIERLDALIHQPAEATVAVAFIDLDNFKSINDTAGHQTGDRVLQEMVDRMEAVLPSGHMIGRLGGDEFALVLSRIAPGPELDTLLETFRMAFEQPVSIGNQWFRISASMGVALHPKDGNTVGELLRSADTAMYKAKEGGRNDVRYFDLQMQEEILHRTEIEKQLEGAHLRGECRMVFQPQFDTAGRHIRGYEALIRWHSPTLGEVPPDRFIPIAEITDIILPLGEWILAESCRVMRSCPSTEADSTILSVNIASRQLHDPDFVDMVRRTLCQTGFDAHRLELEITESSLLTHLEEATGKLQALRADGVRIALDDFGTGYSSLYYLQELPIDTLKIDQSFIRRIGEAHGRSLILNGLIMLCHQLGLEVIAEGVETVQQQRYLIEKGCDGIQGFLFSRPLPRPERPDNLPDAPEPPTDVQ